MDLKEIFQNLDLRPLKKMMAFVLAGKEPPMKEYEVKVRVPEAIIECITPICQLTGASIEDVISQMATEGFSNQMKEAMGSLGQEKAQQSNPFEGLKDLGIDLTGLQDKMGDIQGLGEKLEQMQKVFNEIVTIPTGPQVPSDDDPKDPKDPT